MEAYADGCIRRGCAVVGLAGFAAMLALAPDAVLACRTGAEVAAFLVIGLVLAAWRSPSRRLPEDSVHALLRESGLPRGRHAAASAQAELADAMRARLLWHAERVAAVAMALWLLSLLIWLGR